jgi:hypothetical protein
MLGSVRGHTADVEPTWPKILSEVSFSCLDKELKREVFEPESDHEHSKAGGRRALCQGAASAVPEGLKENGL